MLQTLAAASVVRSRRGMKGGFTLARDAAQMSALDVVNAVDPIRRIRHCPLGRPDHAAGLCPLHRRMDAALGALEQVYADVRLSELVETRGAPPLCHVPIRLKPVGRST